MIPDRDPVARCDLPTGGNDQTGVNEHTGVCCVVCVYTDRYRTGTQWLGVIYLQVVVIKQVLMNKQVYVILCCVCVHRQVPDRDPMAGPDGPAGGNDQTGVNEQTGVCCVVCVHRQVPDRDPVAGSDRPAGGNDQTGVNEQTGVCYVVLCMYR